MKTAYGNLLLCRFLGFIFSVVLFLWFNFPFANAKSEGQLVWEKEIVHAGDLIVDYNQTFLIENYTSS